MKMTHEYHNKTTFFSLFRPQSGILFWWPAGHQLQKSGDQTQILVAKVKKIGSQRYKVLVSKRVKTNILSMI
jgi:hypothetical protein